MTSKYGRSVKCLFVLLLSLTLIRNVSANSAQQYWEGTDASGQIVTEGPSPLIIDSEELTFEIHQFPQTDIGSTSQLQEYTDHVVAEYTLSNPSDYTVTARLFFPFGHVPSYISILDDRGIPQFYPDSSSRGVSVNGQEVEYTLRHSYSHYHKKFDIQKDLSRLKEEVTDHAFFRQDLPVHFYHFKVNGEDLPEDPLLAVTMDSADKSRVCYFKDIRSQSGNGNEITATLYSDMNDDCYHVTVFGEALAELVDWGVYSSSNLTEKNRLEASVELTEHRVSNLRDELLKLKPQGNEISGTDWINAGLDFLEETAGEGPLLSEIGIYTDLSHLLMRWIEYEITLQPGESVVNTVKAPLYPSIDTGYEPAVYQYTYLLSPVSTWASTGSLRVHLNTEFVMLEDQGWIRTGNGYMKSMEEFPQSELDFRLCSSAHPQKQSYANDLLSDPSGLLHSSGLMVSLVFILILPILLLVLLYFVIHHWLRNKH